MSIQVNKQLAYFEICKQTADKKMRFLGFFNHFVEGDKLFCLGRLFCDVLKHIRIQNQYGCGGFGPIEVLDSHRSNQSTYAKNERQIDGITFYVLAYALSHTIIISTLRQNSTLYSFLLITPKIKNFHWSYKNWSKIREMTF